MMSTLLFALVIEQHVMSGTNFNHVMIMLCTTLLLLLSCAKSHMLSASRWQPYLLHVSAVDRRQTWSMD